MNIKNELTYGLPIEATTPLGTKARIIGERTLVLDNDVETEQYVCNLEGRAGIFIAPKSHFTITSDDGK